MKLHYHSMFHPAYNMSLYLVKINKENDNYSIKENDEAELIKQHNEKKVEIEFKHPYNAFLMVLPSNHGPNRTSSVKVEFADKYDKEARKFITDRYNGKLKFATKKVECINESNSDCYLSFLIDMRKDKKKFTVSDEHVYIEPSIGDKTMNSHTRKPKNKDHFQILEKQILCIFCNMSSIL